MSVISDEKLLVNSKKKKASRLISIDFLRGLSMLCLIFFHSFEKTISTDFYDQFFQLPTIQFVLLGLFFYFATWRSVFLIISAIVLMYTWQKSRQNGVPSYKLYFHAIIWSFLLFGQGIMIQIFWNPYTGLYQWINTGEANVSRWMRGIQWSDAVETIAIGIFLTANIQFLLDLVLKPLKNKNRSTSGIQIAVYITFFFITLFSTKYLGNWALKTYGLGINQIQSAPANSFSDSMRYLGLALLVGYQEPIFPYFTATCIGNVIGIMLTVPIFNRKRFLLQGFTLSFILLIAGFSWWIFHDKLFFGGMFMIPPDWLLLVNTGIQLAVILIFLWVFDLNTDHKIKEKHRDRTKIIRSAGVISLTIFSLQALDYIPRWILSKIFHEDFLGFGKLSLGYAILCGFAALIFWIGLIIFWRKIYFIGSFDWLFALIRRKIKNSSISWKDPLLSHDIIYQPDFAFKY